MIGWSAFQTVGRESEYIQDALASGWVSGGPYVDKLEAEITKLFGGGTALAVSNGTAALMLAFQTLGLQPNDRVIVPAFSFQAAANILIQLGAVPVFCDVDPLNWNQSRANIETMLDDTIKGVVVVHNYGAAAEIGPIADLCRSNGIWLIEDAAEAWFTKYNNQFVGRFGDIATFSMHATKTIACGEGGITLINRDDLVKTAKLYRSHGLDRSSVHYKHLLPGNNYRLSNLLAAIAFAQIEKYEIILQNQTKRTNFFRQLLGQVPGLCFQRSLVVAKNELWADAVILDAAITGLSRDELILQINAKGIEMRPGFYAPNTLDYYIERDVSSTPVANHVAEKIFVLPCSPFMTEAEIVDVAQKIRDTITESASYRKTFSLHSLKSTDPVDLQNLQRFVDRLSSNGNSFRYFAKREFKALEQHICTLLAFNSDAPVGYGHIDQDGNTFWIGIAVHSEFKGKKLGHSIMFELLKKAADAKIARLDLFVDRNNVTAQSLYIRYGFVIDEEGSNTSAVRMFRTSPL